MTTFSVRLRELRTMKNLTQKQVAKKTKLSERGYQGYELGEKEPSLANIIKLADFFEVSTDYLLGRVDKP